MISWLQTRFQKHYQVLFIVLLAVLIVSFVFTIGEFPGLGSGQPTAKKVDLFGISLNSEKEKRDFSESAQLSAYLQTGRPGYNPDQIQNYAFQRAAALHLADQFHLPKPTEEQKAIYLQTLALFKGTDGLFSQEAYSDFLDNLNTNPNLRKQTIARVLIEDYRIDQVNKLLGGPGYVLPSEVSSQLARTKTKWTVEQATLEGSGLSFSITPSSEELLEYYEANKFRYGVSEKVEVSYVEFRGERYLSSIPAPDEIALKNYFERNKARFKKPGPPNINPLQPGENQEEVTFEEVRTQVDLEMKLVVAQKAAIQAASDFGYTLFENKVERDSEELATGISRHNLTLKTVPAFTSEESPEEGRWSQQIVKEAFKLSEKHWFSDPLPVGNSAIILFYDDRLVSYIPDFEDVKESVITDFNQAREKELFIEKGSNIQKSLTEQLASGDSFTEAAEKAGLQTQTWPSFTLQTPPSDFDYSLLSRLEQITEGDISDMIVTKEKGTFLHVISKEVPEEALAGEEFDQTTAQLAEMNSRVQQNLIISDLLQQELIKVGLVDSKEE